jgi:hypothetical protein
MAISVGTALVQKSNFISPSATTIQLRDGRREGARKAQSTFAFDLLATDSSNVTIMRGHPANWRAAKTAFNPPKAKELLKITRTGMRRASFGT